MKDRKVKLKKNKSKVVESNETDFGGCLFSHVHSFFQWNGLALNGARILHKHMRRLTNSLYGRTHLPAVKAFVNTCEASVNSDANRYWNVS